jgi:hypothetical protein
MRSFHKKKSAKVIYSKLLAKRPVILRAHTLGNDFAMTKKKSHFTKLEIFLILRGNHKVR